MEESVTQRDTETQKHRNTETQKHRNTETQRSCVIAVLSLCYRCVAVLPTTITIRLLNCLKFVIILNKEFLVCKIISYLYLFVKHYLNYKLIHTRQCATI